MENNHFSLDLSKMNPYTSSKENNDEYAGLKFNHNFSKSVINDNSYKYFKHRKNIMSKNNI